MKYGICLVVEQDGAWAPYERLDQTFDDKSAAMAECDRLNRTLNSEAPEHYDVTTIPGPTDVIPGVPYRHFKGNLYVVRYTANHSETGEALVIYQTPSGGEVWARPLAMWVEEVVWPDGAKRPRFCPDSPELHALFKGV